jgi:hypothetical protein
MLFPLAMVTVICLIGITNAYAFEINTATVSSPKGSSDFDMDYYIIFDDEGTSKVQHNNNSKQTTLTLHKSDLLNGVFNPEDNNTSSLKAFFTKSFKVHSTNVSFDKKYYLKNFECT